MTRIFGNKLTSLSTPLGTWHLILGALWFYEDEVMEVGVGAVSSTAKNTEMADDNYLKNTAVGLAYRQQ